MKAFMAARVVAGLVVVLALAAGGGAEAASFGYITGPDPWGVTSNDAAMDVNFGVGGWDKMDWTAGTAALAGGYSFLFIDGGDGASTNFNSFVTANKAALEAFVSGGGHLLINAARWDAPLLNLGFGAAMAYNPSFTGAAVNPAAPLFAGPFGATGANWTGNYFSHDEVLGDYGTALIVGGSGQVLLSTKAYGAGNVMFGTITDPVFQGPSPEVYNLRANMIAYASTAVPEPSSLVMAGLGAAAVGAAAARRRA